MTRVKYETIESFELLRKAVRAEENEMKLTSNISQQQWRPQKRREETGDDKMDLILKRIETLEKGIGRGRGKRRDWYNYYNYNESFQYNRQQDKKEEQEKDKVSQHRLNSR